MKNYKITVKKSYFTFRFDFEKEQEDFEMKHHNYRGHREEEHCIYHIVCEDNKNSNKQATSGITEKGYVEFYFKSYDCKNACKEALSRYEKFLSIYKITDSIDFAGRALGGRSKKEVDDEIFQEQLDWHNMVFQ